MRLFVAIWLPTDIVKALPLPLLHEHLTRQGVRFTKPEKIHLTLRFLGNVDPARVDELVVSLSSALTGLSSVSLSASGLGGFPHLDRPKVVFAGILGELTAVHERVIEATDDFAEQAADELTPHLTLARVSPPSSKVGRALQPLVQQTAGALFGEWTASEVRLVETLGDGTYRSVAEFPLRDN